MAGVGKHATEAVVGLLTAPGGLSDNLAAMMELEQVTVPEITTGQILQVHVGQDVLERSAGARYPAVHVYCEKFTNTLREKFRPYSGQAQTAIEVRVSQDRIEGLEVAVQLYMDAVTRVLDQNRGDWGHGLFYTGGYDVTFGAVRHGGRNFLQIAKVTFEIQVSQ